MTITYHDNKRSWSGDFYRNWSINVGTGATYFRYLHPHEARFYDFAASGTAGFVGKLPVDVRGWTLGHQLIVRVHTTSVKSMRIVDANDAEVGWVDPGENGKIWLIDNDTMAGDWFMHVTSNTPNRLVTFV